MTLALASILAPFTFFVVAASLQNVPGCLPGEKATIVSQSVFGDIPILSPGVGGVTNATITFFTCPSRDSPVVAPPSTPIDVCGLIDNSEPLFGEGTFNCTQGPTNEPTLAECGIIDDMLQDSFARTAEVVIPPRSGAVMSIFNNSCVFVFLNDDTNDTYSVCVGTISEMNTFTAEEECFSVAQDGFRGSYRSPVQPGVQNWEWHIAYAPDLDFDVGS
ncbi:hypothetical protein MSAN_01607300 [Mycena sanguinolenta]|uniref:Uncharacterized protein n=1 Tax=Mycena sanguinolenta TaxID=230812 RepID=A0A8H6Y4D3_9AGAR|nr:hypothetical protein MSAN_01607300 [Mycena sanguinolenta]